MRITPSGEGARLRLDTTEADALGALLDDLIAALGPDGLGADDPVRLRLFPDGYRDDPAAASAFRELTEGALRAERLERAQRCREELARVAELPVQGTFRRGRDLELGGADVQRWLQVLNDLRLAFGTRLGVTEDEPPELDPGDPEATGWGVYAYLTALQDALVRAVMRDA